VTATCPSAIHLCYARFTRLNAVGQPVAGPNNVYVINTPMMLTVTPDILAGEVRDLKGGCDQLIATYRGQDILKRYNLELDIATVEPGLDEMLTGGSIILGGTSGTDPIGVQNQLACNTQQPYTAIEFWQDLWNCDNQPSSPFQYLRWVWPSSRWQNGAVTLQNDFMQPKFTGFTVGNSNLGTGIFHDWPTTVQADGAYFFDNTLPSAACGYQSHSIT
jgi:hypothetical protein